MTPQQLEDGELAVEKIIAFAADLYPPLALYAPIIDAFLRHQVALIKAGVADGSIIADGKGGFVRSDNSRFDPKTGDFL